MDFYAKLMDAPNENSVENFLDENGFHRTTELLTHFFKASAANRPEILLVEVEDEEFIRCGAVRVSKFEEHFTWADESDLFGPFRRVYLKT